MIVDSFGFGAGSAGLRNPSRSGANRLNPPWRSIRPISRSQNRTTWSPVSSSAMPMSSPTRARLTMGFVGCGGGCCAAQVVGAPPHRAEVWGCFLPWALSPRAGRGALCVGRGWCRVGDEAGGWGAVVGAEVGTVPGLQRITSQGLRAALRPGHGRPCRCITEGAVALGLGQGGLCGAVRLAGRGRGGYTSASLPRESSR